MKTIIAVCDSCVLYPAPLRDLLMHLAVAGLYQAKWTNEIHDEWIRNVLANRVDLKLAQLERTRELMNKYAYDCLVDGYRDLVPSLKLPDSNDRHVLAAAIKSQSSTIITYNLKDFPQAILNKYGVNAQHPDQFLMQLIDFNADEFCNAARRVRTNLKNPTITTQRYLAILEQQLLPKTVQKLKSFSNLL